MTRPIALVQRFTVTVGGILGAGDNHLRLESLHLGVILLEIQTEEYFEVCYRELDRCDPSNSGREPIRSFRFRVFPRSFVGGIAARMF